LAKSRTIKESFLIQAHPSKVLNHLTSPAKLKRWFLESAKLSPRKGGNYQFVWQGGYNHVGKVTDYAKDSKLGLSWPAFWKGKEVGTTKVTFRLKPKENGTLLQLTHAGYKRAGDSWVELYAMTYSGWAYYCMNLKSVIETGKDLRRQDDVF